MSELTWQHVLWIIFWWEVARRTSAWLFKRFYEWLDTALDV
jgi:hypothetical protein